jgi:hypothetical protein
MHVRVSLCFTLLRWYSPCDGPIPRPRSPISKSKGFIVSINPDSEQAIGPNP